jgi:predicted MFS family arabinose efflux permease
MKQRRPIGPGDQPATPTEPLRPATDSTPAITRRLTLIIAAACGLLVANNTYAQPILVAIARDLHTTSASAGLVVTLTSAGYALGLLLMVPLGDILDRRRLVLGLLPVAAAALVASALAPSVQVLAAAGIVAGVASASAQILVPMAASLASPQERGKVVGNVMTGLLLGLLLGRTLAGLLSRLAGWRSVFWVAAGLMLVLALVLWRELPRLRSAVRLSYPALLVSIAGLVRREPLLRRRALYGALVFAAFIGLWTTIAFLLAGPPFHYPPVVVGLFGLAGVTGALCASFAGRMADRGQARAATGLFLAVTAASYVVLGLGATWLLAVVLGVVLLDLGVQGAHITNQSEIYRNLPGEERSRVTTVYMVSVFLGGAAGSAAAATAFQAFGWTGVCVLGVLYGLVGLAVWALSEFRAAEAAQATGPATAPRGGER